MAAITDLILREDHPAMMTLQSEAESFTLLAPSLGVGDKLCRGMPPAELVRSPAS
jgi:hypothetical protein